jgi:hypothetical protein
MKYFYFFILSIFFISCSKEQNTPIVRRPELCDSASFTFVKDVLPILNSYCNFRQCHASEEVGGYDFKEYEVVANRIRAGTFEYRLGLPFDDPQHMPVNIRLNACDYFIIKTWIKQSFPEK